MFRLYFCFWANIGRAIFTESKNTTLKDKYEQQAAHVYQYDCTHANKIRISLTEAKRVHIWNCYCLYKFSTEKSNYLKKKQKKKNNSILG